MVFAEEEGGSSTLLTSIQARVRESAAANGFEVNLALTLDPHPHPHPHPHPNPNPNPNPHPTTNCNPDPDPNPNPDEVNLAEGAEESFSAVVSAELLQLERHAHLLAPGR